jgi:hypothetical protein
VDLGSRGRLRCGLRRQWGSAHRAGHRRPWGCTGTSGQHPGPRASHVPASTATHIPAAAGPAGHPRPPAPSPASQACAHGGRARTAAAGTHAVPDLLPADSLPALQSEPLPQPEPLPRHTHTQPHLPPHAKRDRELRGEQLTEQWGQWGWQLIVICAVSATALVCMAIFAQVASWIDRHPDPPAEDPGTALRSGRWHRMPAATASVCTCPAPPRWLSRPLPPQAFPFLNRLLLSTVTQGDRLCANRDEPPGRAGAHRLAQAGRSHPVAAAFHGRPATIRNTPAWPPPSPPEQS